MSAIISRWLNEDVKLSKHIDTTNFAKEFSNGFLFGELLAKFGYQSDFEEFSKGITNDAKLANFMRLGPAFSRFGIPFNSISAREIMDEKPGAATKLAYQFFVAFNKKQPSAPVAADAKATSRELNQKTFDHLLKTRTKRQFDVEYAELDAQFKQRFAEKEQSLLRAREADADRIEQARKRAHQQVLDREREARKAFEAQATLKADVKTHTRSIRSPKAQLAPIGMDTTRIQRLAEATFKPETPDEVDVMPLNADGKTFVETIKSKLGDESFAAQERNKRRRRVLVQHFEIQEEIEKQHRASIMASKLNRKSVEERRIAAQLMAIRHEKDVIKEHRLFRDQQIEEQRKKDFEIALDREAALITHAKLEFSAELNAENSRVERLKAERAQQMKDETQAKCRQTVLDIVDFALKIVDYREITSDKIPPALIRDWRNKFTACLPLNDVNPPASSTKEDIVLNDDEFLEYNNVTGTWAAFAADDAGTSIDVPHTNANFNKVIENIRHVAHPSVPKIDGPKLLPARIRVAVIGKMFSGKSSNIHAAAQALGINIVNPRNLLSMAVEAFQAKSVTNVTLEEVAPVKRPFDGTVC